MTRRGVFRALVAVALGMSLVASISGCTPVEDDHSLPADPDSAYGLPLLLGLEPIVRDETLPLAENAISQVALLNGLECDPGTVDRAPCQYEILFAQPPAGLAVGSVLVSSVTPVLPAGLLVRVTAVDGPRIQAVEAKLSEALEQGEFRVEQEFGPADVVDETLAEGVTSTTASIDGESGLSRGSVQDGGNLDFNYIVGHVQIADGVFADGAVAFSVGCGAYAGLTWKKKWGIPLYPNGAYFQASCGVTQDGSLQISGEKGGTFSNTAHIATVTLDTIVTWVGPVPIVLIPKVSIDVTASGELAAGVSFGVSEHFGANIGIKYTDDFHLIHDFSRNLSNTAVYTDTRVSADGDVTVGESLLLYGVAGPTMSETLYMNLKSKPPGQKPLWCMRGGLRASVSLSVDLGITDLEWGPGSVFDEDAELACAGNIPPSVTINYPFDGASVFPGTTNVLPTFFVGVATDPEEGPLSITWSSSRDGVIGTTGPSSDKLSTNGLSLGEHVITATATDSDGASATASITLEAYTAGPAVDLLTKDGSGNWNPISTVSGSVGDQVYVRAATSHTLVGAAPGCNTVQWESALSVSSNGTCDYTILLTQEGYFPITGTVTDHDGRTASATLYVDVGPAPSVAVPQLSSITATHSNPTYALADGGALSGGEMATLQASYLNHDAAGVAVRYEWTVSRDGGDFSYLLGSDPQPDSGTSRQFKAPSQYKVNSVYVFRVTMVNQSTDDVIQTRTFTLVVLGDPG